MEQSMPESVKTLLFSLVATKNVRDKIEEYNQLVRNDIYNTRKDHTEKLLKTLKKKKLDIMLLTGQLLAQVKRTNSMNLKKICTTVMNINNVKYKHVNGFNTIGLCADSSFVSKNFNQQVFVIEFNAARRKYLDEKAEVGMLHSLADNCDFSIGRQPLINIDEYANVDTDSDDDIASDDDYIEDECMEDVDSDELSDLETSDNMEDDTMEASVQQCVTPSIETVQNTTTTTITTDTYNGSGTVDPRIDPKNLKYIPTTNSGLIVFQYKPNDMFSLSRSTTEPDTFTVKMWSETAEELALYQTILKKETSRLTTSVQFDENNLMNFSLVKTRKEIEEEKEIAKKSIYLKEESPYTDSHCVCLLPILFQPCQNNSQIQNVSNHIDAHLKCKKGYIRTFRFCDHGLFQHLRSIQAKSENPTFFAAFGYLQLEMAFTKGIIALYWCDGLQDLSAAQRTHQNSQHLTGNYNLLRRMESLYDELLLTRIAERGYGRVLPVKLANEFRSNFKTVIEHLHTHKPIDEEEIEEFYTDDVEAAVEHQTFALEKESIYFK